MISQLRCGCGRFQLIRSVLIYGMCLFEDGIGVARRRPQRAPSLTVSTSEQTSRNHFRLRTSGISREMSLSMREPSVSPRGADAVGSLLRGERRYGRDALSNTFSECVLAKANEADCGAQTPKSKHVRKGTLQLRYMSNTLVEAEQIYLIMLRLRKILAKKTMRKASFFCWVKFACR